MKNLFLLFTVILLPIITNGQEQNLNVLGKWIKYSDVENSLYHYYTKIVFNSLDKRETEIAKLKTKTDWEARKIKVKQKFLEVVGEFPEKTPLNAKIIEVIQKKKYRIEKIIFESQPKFYVTAIMYIPNNIKSKTPAIIYTSGHSNIAYRAQSYQQVCINLVSKGFIVFAFDPVSQGERLQYIDTLTNKSIIGSCTREHAYEGNQCFMVGSSLANYMIWDGIRAVDYLLSRKEVDTNKIGITGRSGGGTQSAYIAAFDNRIKAVAIENYITNFKYLWSTIGPQDAEQNFLYGILKELDQADLLEVRVPKPAIQITTTRDIFNIQGAKETEREVKKVYKIYNAEGNFYRAEDDDKHISTKKNREELYAFFQKYLNLPGSSQDEKIDLLSVEELNVTEKGQVLASLGGETVFSLNKKRAENLITKNKLSAKIISDKLKSVVKSAKKITGYKKPLKIEEAVFVGRYRNDNYYIEKYFIKSEIGVPIPFLFFIPNKITASPILYLNPKGKVAENNEIEGLLKFGHPVLSADLIGFGELHQNVFSLSDFSSGYGAISTAHLESAVVTNKSIVGIHAADIQRLVLFLKNKKNLNSKKIFGIAKGDLCPALAHAAAFEKSFSRIALINPLVSYASVVLNRYYKINPMFPFIPGVLTAYDLPDIEAAIVPGKLLILNARDQMNKIIPDEALAKNYSIVKTSYEKSNLDKKLQIKNLMKGENLFDVYSLWLQ